ncbi:MAG TPA: TrkA family potassium uptake protein [Candidatus Limnocylindria bacterium]|nr:TrkA family potassium uptake protein [Candidatus Limnocylindria bacterium]
MGILPARAKSGLTVIIGCGRLGASVANAISDAGGDVLVMDKDKGAFRKLSPSFGGLTVTGDGTDLDALRDAKVSEAQAVIVVTDNDNTNIMVAQLAREVYKATHVIARLYDSDREFVYHELGIHSVCPSLLSVMEIQRVMGGLRAAEPAKTPVTA